MLRFAFKPRHPITRVAFTADGREVITAQPLTGIAVRDRLTGVARVKHELPRAQGILRLEVHPTLGGIVVHANGSKLLDPTDLRSREIWEGEPPNNHYVPEMLLAFEMWWRGSTTGERVDIYARARGTPSVSCAGRTVFLSSRLRQRHNITGAYVLRYAPDGTKLAVGDGERLDVFDLQRLDSTPLAENGPRPTLTPLFTLERPDPTRHGTFADKQAEYWLPPVAFDHAGRTMFTLGLRNRVQRIDLATGGVMSEWGWRCEPTRSLAVAPDDLTAAAGCQRGELVMWDLE